jgi:hypothetical protein
MKETKGEKIKKEYCTSGMTLILEISCQQCIFNFSSITMTFTEVTQVIQIVGHYSIQPELFVEYV